MLTKHQKKNGWPEVANLRVWCMKINHLCVSVVFKNDMRFKVMLSIYKKRRELFELSSQGVEFQGASKLVGLVNSQGS